MQAEISENTRLKKLYEERLHLLVTRDPELQLVRERAEHLYFTYEMHFKTKIAKFELCLQAASSVCDKWKMQQEEKGSTPNHLGLDAWSRMVRCIKWTATDSNR